MKLLFKINNPGSNNNTYRLDTSVKDTNFKDHYPTVNSNMSWSNLAPFIRQSVSTFIYKYIGSELYQTIADAYEAGNITDANKIEILTSLQDCIAHYSIALALPKFNGSISDIGLQEVSGKEGASAPVALWRYKLLCWDAIYTADMMLDNLLSLLNSSADSWATIWKGSNAYKNNTHYLFSSVQELERYIKISESTRTYWSLIAYLNITCKKYIYPILGEDLIKLYLQKSTPNEFDIALIDHIREAVSKFLLVEALPQLRVVIESDGVKMVSKSDFYDSKKIADSDAIYALSKINEENGRTFIADLNRFLSSNVDNLPDYKASKYYSELQIRNQSIISSPDRYGGIMM